MQRFNGPLKAIKWVLVHADGDCSFEFTSVENRKNHIRGSFIKGHSSDPQNAGLFVDATDYQTALAEIVASGGDTN